MKDEDQPDWTEIADERNPDLKELLIERELPVPARPQNFEARKPRSALAENIVSNKMRVRHVDWKDELRSKWRRA